MNNFIGSSTIYPVHILMQEWTGCLHKTKSSQKMSENRLLGANF